jgi:NADPH-dependent 2,4-dienoyl-CoA reductase/sulfur reductase-like enzyme
MNRLLDLIVIGAGPAGMAAAATGAECGLSTLLIDEQAEPGGQIYRSIESIGERRPDDVALFGDDYAHGAHLARELRRSAALYLPSASVFEVTPEADEVAVAVTVDGAAERLAARRVIVATGAMERPVPVPGWTMPGVMGAGAAQLLLKSAVQLVDAGAEVVAVLERTRFADYLGAARHLFRARRAPGYIAKGRALRRRLKAAGVPIRSGVTGLRIEGLDRPERVLWDGGAVDADVVLLHEGVVPHVQITRQIGADHIWDPAQRCWRPVLDEWGGSSVANVIVAGDSGGIGGARVAEATGRLAALQAAHLLGRLSQRERNRRAAAPRGLRRRHLAIRPLLDALFPPSAEILAPPDDATIVCRCEEVTAGEIRAAVALGAAGPNQLKAFTRCGMGPCQGRLCVLTVADTIAAARSLRVAQIGYYRIRPPIKPVTLGELAALDG